MGEVYLGEKLGPEGFVKPVVLKCVLPQLAKDRAFVQLFLDEARLAALLNHPNIAQVYDFGLVDDIYYIAMEYVPGYTVDDIRRKLRSIRQHLPLQHVACVASQVCQGLHYAHVLTDATGESLGLVHRDVSPHNLIVSIDGSVKIVDFGIAKARAGLTRVQATGAVGKFGYMSPEQGRGEVVDARSDLFSLGVCLWELCTNERLHDPKLARAPEYSAARPIPPVDRFRNDVPGPFQEILDTALAVFARDRYATAQDMHIVLERFQAAMTHYAGQAALARYIKDLVEGRVGTEDDRSGRMMAPVRPALRRPVAEPALDGAGKPEEVFGVTLGERRSRPAVSEFREPRNPEAEASDRPVDPGGARVIDFSEEGSDDDGSVPGLATLPPAKAPPVRTILRASSPPARPSRRIRPPRRTRPLWGPLLLLGVLALSVTAFALRDRVRAAWGRLDPGDGGGGTRPPVHSRYRLESRPAGASVFVDGNKQAGVTPMEVDLMPGLRHTVVVRKKGRATAERAIDAEPLRALRVVRFALPPAARLTIRSVPPGATVTVNGRRIPDRVTPMTLDDVAGDVSLEVRVEVEGMRPRVRSVVVPAGKQRRITVELL